MSISNLASTITGHPPLRAYAPLSPLQVTGDQLCSYCLKSKSACVKGLQKCSACKRVSYCGPSCQKDDWKIYHKHFCPQFKKVNDFDHEVLGDRPLSLLELISTQETRIGILSKGNQHGENDACNRNFIQDEVRCQVCNRTPFQKAEYRPFEICKGCEYARICSDECKAKLPAIHSPEDCAALRLVVAVDRVSIDYALSRKSPRQLMIQTPDPRSTYIPLSRITDWSDYHRRIFPDFDYACKFIGNEFKASHPDHIKAIARMAMEATCIPLTVIAALESADLVDRTALRIHFVGAATRELHSQGMMEELLHYLPRLKKLHVTYIGPEVGYVRPNIRPDSNLACEKCQRRKFSRTCSYHYDEYQTFKKEKADLIVALNTGMTEVDPVSWRETVKDILKEGVPAVFTAYTEMEARQEDRMLREMGAKFLVEYQPNKWRGVIPKLNKMQKLFAADDIGMSYNSNWWYVFHG